MSKNDIKKEKNRKKILHALKYGAATVTEISDKVGVSRKTVYKHLNNLMWEKLVYKDEDSKKYYLKIDYLKNLMRDAKLKKDINLKDYAVDLNKLEEELKKDYNKICLKDKNKNVSIKSVSNAEKYLWFYGLDFKIWNTALENEDYDFEIFLAARNLVLSILKKIKQKNIFNMGITLQLDFNPLTATQVLLYNLKQKGIKIEDISTEDISMFHIAMNKILNDSEKINLIF